MSLGASSDVLCSYLLGIFARDCNFRRNWCLSFGECLINLFGRIDLTLCRVVSWYHPTKGNAVEIVRLLLEHGADPNIRASTTRHSSTPLHEASSRGLLDIAQLLLSYGANVDVKNTKGKTPFQLAASAGHGEMTTLLLEHGAVP